MQWMGVVSPPVSRLYRRPVRRNAIGDTGHTRTRGRCWSCERKRFVIAVSCRRGVAGQERLCEVVVDMHVIVRVDGRVVSRRRERDANGWERVVRVAIVVGTSVDRAADWWHVGRVQNVRRGRNR